MAMIRKTFAQGKVRIPENKIGESVRVYRNFNNLVNEILETEEITDELFKKIGEALVDKIWFWESVEKALNEEFLM